MSINLKSELPKLLSIKRKAKIKDKVKILMPSDPIDIGLLRNAISLASWDRVEAYLNRPDFNQDLLKAQDDAGFVPLHSAVFHRAPVHIVEILMGKEKRFIY